MSRSPPAWYSSKPCVSAALPKAKHARTAREVCEHASGHGLSERSQLFRPGTVDACTKIVRLPREADRARPGRRYRIPEHISHATGLRRARVPDGDSAGDRVVPATAFRLSFAFAYLFLRSLALLSDLAISLAGPPCLAPKKRLAAFERVRPELSATRANLDPRWPTTAETRRSVSRLPLVLRLAQALAPTANWPRPNRPENPR